MISEFTILIAGVIEWGFDNPEVGWILVVFYLMFEIRGPYGKVSKTLQQIEKIVTVVQALARSHQAIDTDKVDQYLAGNGKGPYDFFEEGTLGPDSLIKEEEEE